MTFILKPAHIQQFHAMLAAEAESGEALMQVLEQEHQLLVKGEAEEIRAISKQKQLLVRRMAELLLARDRFLTALGLPSGREGTGQLVEYAHPTAELELAWKRIEQLAPRLHEQNEINGGIVALAQRHVRAALDILTNQNEQSPTYGRSGLADGRSPQSLAKA
ncbi:MAG: flagellar protein FlgN [Gammaproteobacteria bacterium]|nr:flagellar protein FlgN [Gammaproteobacteria bacterium]